MTYDPFPSGVPIDRCTTRVDEARLVELELLEKASQHAEDTALEDGRDCGVGRILLDEQNALFNALEDGGLVDLIADLRAARTMLYTLVQIASTRSDWKEHTWKFIEECSSMALAGSKGMMPEQVVEKSKRKASEPTVDEASDRLWDAEEQFRDALERDQKEKL